MFLNFKKLSNAITDVLVKSDSIMLVESDSVFINGTTYPNATRIEIAGYSRMGFHTTSTFAQVTSVLYTVDVTAGFDPTVCGADLVYPAVSYPLITTNMVFNSTLSEIEPFAFNPTFLISAEEVTFIDVVSHAQQIGLMVSLHDVNPRRVLTDLTLAQLKTILRAVDVPTT